MPRSMGSRVKGHTTILSHTHTLLDYTANDQRADQHVLFRYYAHRLPKYNNNSQGGLFFNNQFGERERKRCRAQGHDGDESGEKMTNSLKKKTYGKGKNRSQHQNHMAKRSFFFFLLNRRACVTQVHGRSSCHLCSAGVTSATLS